MIAGVVFIGDEVSAAGMRLAGVRTITPEPGRVQNELVRLAREASVVLVTAEAASEVSDDVIRDLTTSLLPLVLIMADLTTGQQPDDVVTPIREHLGIREDLIAPE